MNNGLQGWGLAAVVLLLSLVAGAAAPARAQVHLESETLVRAFERDTAAEEDALVLPLYEYLSGGIGTGSPGLSFHISGWGRLDAADNDYYSDTTAGELLYGYLEYTRPFSSLTLRAGRQYAFEGVSNEAFDGLYAATDLPGGFSISAYGGLPVGLTSTAGSSGDALYGGRLAHRLANVYAVGVSYKLAENDDLTAQELVGGDLALYLPGGLALYGLSRYNLETEDFAEHSYELRMNLGNLTLRPFFERYRYQDYFNAGAKTVNPFVFLALTEEILTSYGADLTWRTSERWDVGLKAKVIDYDQADSVFYVAATAALYGEGTTAWGGEAGRLEGDLSDDSYTLLRAFAYLDLSHGEPSARFLSADALYALYDEKIRGEDAALFVSLGAGRSFLQRSLTVKVAGEYSADPYYTSDLRGTLLFTYLFDR